MKNAAKGWNGSLVDVAAIIAMAVLGGLGKIDGLHAMGGVLLVVVGGLGPKDAKAQMDDDDGPGPTAAATAMAILGTSGVGRMAAPFVGAAASLVAPAAAVLGLRR